MNRNLEVCTIEPVPVANGASTDHPVLNLPFVDDSHLPTDPVAIGDIGRSPSRRGWGRTEISNGGQRSYAPGEWLAATNDPGTPRWVWLVHEHPEHGRQVLLFDEEYRDTDAAEVVTCYWNESPHAFLIRAGGYWWNGGTQWYRPRQVINLDHGASARPVQSCVSLTADQYMPPPEPGVTVDHSLLAEVATFEPVMLPLRQWQEHLRRWAATRSADARPLSECIVSLAAPELEPDNMKTITDVAELYGVQASSLRSMVSRGMRDLPQPQYTSPRLLWSAEVVADWQEQEKRERPKELLTDDPAHGPTLAQDMAAAIEQTLREQPSPVKRRVDVSELSWRLGGRAAAVARRKELPVQDIENSLVSMCLWDAHSHLKSPLGKSEYHDGDFIPFMFTPSTERLVGSHIAREPNLGPRLLVRILNGLTRQLGLPRKPTYRVVCQLARDSLVLHDYDEDRVKEYLTSALPPELAEIDDS